MKAIYICDYCGAEWSTEEDCITCENSHKDEIESKNVELTNAKEDLIARYNGIKDKIKEEQELFSAYAEALKESKKYIDEYWNVLRDFQKKYPNVTVTTIEPGTHTEVTLVEPETNSTIDTESVDGILGNLFSMFNFV